MTKHSEQSQPRPRHSRTGRNGRTGLIRSGRTAFTMMELMLTIGILAVAITMVASIFPVAILESNQSYKDIVGTLVCENGLAVAKAMIEQDPHMDGLADILGTDGVDDRLDIVADEYDDGGSGGPNDHTTIISLQTQHYQELLKSDYVSEGGSLIDDDDYKIQGFAVLGREFHDAYQLVIVSYHRPKDHKALFTTITTNAAVAADATTFNTSSSTDGLIGSPVIVRNTGLYSTIISVNGSEIKLERPFGEGLLAGDELFVMIEDDSGTIQKKSPALSVLVTLTGLEN